MAGDVATGLKTGRTYDKTDIPFDGPYTAMSAEALVDNDELAVIPVNRKNSPHFRYLGSPVKPSRLGQVDPSPAHNKTVVDICNALSGARSVEIFTYNFDDDYQGRLKSAQKKLDAEKKIRPNDPALKKYASTDKETQVLFSYEGRGRFTWFSEADARVRFDDWTWIQPDIAGRPTSAFMPTGRAPGIIIEVIRTHCPEPETFRKLVKLSRTGIHVYFYFVDEACKKTFYNQMDVGLNGTVRLRIAHALIAGECVSNGQVKELSRTPAPKPADENNGAEGGSAKSELPAPFEGNEDDTVWVTAALRWLENLRKTHD